jgi:putative tryptophan/tyrosine transport system substrate-binding protein
VLPICLPRVTLATPPTKVGIVHSGHSGRHDSHIKALKDAVNSVTSNANFVNVRYAHDGDPTNEIKNAINTDNVQLLVAAGGTACAMAAQGPSGTANIPVVYTSVSFAASPAANMTGVCAHTSELDEKRLGYLQRALPGAKKFGVLFNTTRFNAAAQNTRLQAVAVLLNLSPLSPTGIDPTSGTPVKTQIATAFANWKSAGIEGAIVAADPLFNNNRLASNGGLIAAANSNGIPTIYQWREFADDDGFMTYGPNLSVAYTLAGFYAGRIVNNPNAVQNAPLSLNNFELTINLKTAKALGKTIPDSLLSEADYIIT